MPPTEKRVPFCMIPGGAVPTLQLAREYPELILAEASNTTWSLVLELDSLKTAWIDMQYISECEHLISSVGTSSA